MKNGNRPVYPNTNWGSDALGLTKREYFSAMAMQGLLSNSAWMESYDGKLYLMHATVVSEMALGYADKMLIELEKPKP